MISWIVTGCRVGVIDSRPTLSRVAVDTLRVSDEVVVATLRLAADRNHTIMAGFAAIIDALMIEGASGKGRCGIAERAISGYCDMSKRRRSKAAVDMADTTVLPGWQVIGGLEQFRTVREKLILVTAAALLGGWNVIADLRRGDTCRMTDCAVIRIYPDMAEDDARQAVETAFGGQGVCGHSCGFAVVASCRSAALASGFDENVQLKPSGSAELVTDLLPSRLAVSPTRRRIMGPVLATTLVKPSADGFSPDAGSVVGFWPKGDSDPPDPPQAEIPKTSENTNKLFVRN